MPFYRILFSIIFLLNSSIAYAQMSCTAVLSSGDVIVTKWNNASHSGSAYDYFVSSDIISITVNGNQADISRIPNRYLEFYWGNSGYSLTSNPPAAGTDITQYLDFMTGLYLDDNSFQLFELLCL